MQVRPLHMRGNRDLHMQGRGGQVRNAFYHRGKTLFSKNMRLIELSHGDVLQKHEIIDNLSRVGTSLRVGCA